MNGLRRLTERLRRLVILIVQLVAGLLMLVAGLTYWKWIPLKNLAFRESLVAHAKAIRQTSCPIERKELLLDRLDDVMDDLQAGETVGLVRWMEFYDAVRPLLQDGITSDEQRLVEREIDRLERDLRRAAINWTKLLEKEP